MNHKKNKRINRVVLLISVLMVVGIPYVFDLKTSTSNAEFRGFPVDWLALYPDNGFSFKGMGFLVNVIFFYVALTFMVKRVSKKGESS